MEFKQRDDPAFSLAETAAMADVAETKLRDWHGRGLSQWIGLKAGHNVRYSATEAAILAVARDLIGLKFPPIVAGRAAAALLAEPPAEAEVVRLDPERILSMDPPAGMPRTRELVRAPGVADAVIELPLGRIWSRVMRRAEATYGVGR